MPKLSGNKGEWSELYVLFKLLAEIAEEEHYSYQYTTELHRIALKKVQKSINNQQNLVESFI